MKGDKSPSTKPHRTASLVPTVYVKFQDSLFADSECGNCNVKDRSTKQVEPEKKKKKKRNELERKVES